MSDKPKKKFIVAISDATAKNRDAVSNRLKSLGFGYWHWMPDMWLLTTNSAATAESIRDEVMKVVPGVNIFVTPVATPPDGMVWAAYSPEEWWEWLNKNWI
jgi:hypothetical protein